MNITTNKLIIGGAVGVVICLIVIAVLQGREAAERASVIIENDVTLSVRVADNAWERQRGLSGLSAEEVKAQGMLFVFQDAAVRDFWMKGMQLDLDVLWIKDGKIVASDIGVPAPDSGQAPQHMTSAPIPVDMVLELPAGYVRQFDLQPGMPLKIELP